MPPVEALLNLSVILKSLETSLNKGINDYIANVQIRAKDLLDRGIDPDEVQRILLEDVKNNSGEFKQLTGMIGGQLDKSIGQTAMDTAQQAVAELSDQYRWDWEPGAEHCDTCQQYNGKVKSYEEWSLIGLPGAGLTDCGIYCKCSLQPI